jgi:replicative DNA helicase
LTTQIPPHNLEAERAVLGAILLEGTAGLERVAGRLRPDDFYLEAHRILYQRILALLEQEQAVDVLTLSDALRDAGELEQVGGMPVLALLTEQAAILAHLEEYVRIVVRDGGKREAIQVLTRAVTHAGNSTSPAQLATDVGEALNRIAERAEPEAFRDSTQRLPAFVPIADVMERTHLELRFGVAELVGSPIAYLDQRFAGGFKRKELVIFGAAPGIGKSAFIVDWARHAALRGHRVGIITIEMANEDVGERLLVQAGPISASAMRGRTLDDRDWEALDRVVPELAGLPIEFADDVTHVQQIGRMLKRREERHQEGFRLLFVDYLQLLDAPRAQARYQEVSLIAKLLKRYAKKYDTTVVAVSSFTPGPPERGRKRARPTMRNLRESRDLDHHADGILLMWKPKEDSSDRELIIDKGRAGQTGAVTLAFTGQYLSFQEMAT